MIENNYSEILLRIERKLDKLIGHLGIDNNTDFKYLKDITEKMNDKCLKENDINKEKLLEKYRGKYETKR